MKKRAVRIFGNVNTLTFSAILCAMSVVIGMFCKTYMNGGNGLFRVTFENLPIIVSGIFYGPIIGAVIGGASDLISYVLSPQVYPPNLTVTVGAISIGLVSGLVSRFVVKKRGYKKIIISGISAHIIGSMIIKPIGLFQFYGIAVLLRIPFYVVIASIEITLICLLYRNRNFRKIFETALKKQHVGRESLMTYNEALEYIHSVCWKGSRPGLERITELCARLGNPQNDLKFIHVTGTNGKGSTCAMTESILREAGFKTGLFTSPYVKEFNERMRVNGKNVSDERLAYVTSLVKPHADAMSDAPTEFELITAIAFMLFKLEGCEIVVLEAGMGGRLDSTNVIEKSVVSVITGVALEHTEYLGDTIEKIANEKAGIIKKDCPVVYGGLDAKEKGEAYRVIEKRAKELNAPLVCVDYDLLNVKSATLEGTALDYVSLYDLKLPLLGLYQPQNCAKALEIIGTLRLWNYNISNEAIKVGLAKTVWRARFEKLSDVPLVLYDGSHNPEGIEVAYKTLKHYFGDKKVNILTGVMADKDYTGMMSTLSPLVNKAFCITPDNPRSLPANDLKNTFEALGVKATAFETITDAVKNALEESEKTDTPLICLGSLYMYAEITDAMGI